MCVAHADLPPTQSVDCEIRKMVAALLAQAVMHQAARRSAVCVCVERNQREPHLAYGCIHHNLHGSKVCWCERSAKPDRNDEFRFSRPQQQEEFSRKVKVTVLPQ
ncbi:uncharacterized protein LOC119769476 [Culex quinquefasciatus]|uniref:uncharacterized protein LOC119769476 n=1 Tax=Culex quinquefasciatus TaxID=7176 RepID=UPI0018E3D7A2|nr:uncharacterized protein LOC119769476 [Culex quinquefasciatus]